MSHTRFLYHIVFATKDRVPLISENWETDLYRYLAGIIKNHDGEAIEIGGIADHIHLLVRLEPKTSFSDFMRELKASPRDGYAKITNPNSHGSGATARSR